MNRTNVGGRDRLLRAVAAVALLYVAGRARQAGRQTAAELAAVAAGSFLYNVATGYCAMNAAVGRDTSADRRREQRFDVNEPAVEPVGHA